MWPDRQMCVSSRFHYLKTFLQISNGCAYTMNIVRNYLSIWWSAEQKVLHIMLLSNV